LDEAPCPCLTSKPATQADGERAISGPLFCTQSVPTISRRLPGREQDASGELESASCASPGTFLGPPTPYIPSEAVRIDPDGLTRGWMV